MIDRRHTLALLGSLTFASHATLASPLGAETSGSSFEEKLQKITRGEEPLFQNLSIQTDEIAKQSEPLLVSVSADPPRDREGHISAFYLLLSAGPWPLVYNCIFNSRLAFPRFATKIRILESCMLYALAKTDQGDFFAARQNVKLSAGAYAR